MVSRDSEQRPSYLSHLPGCGEEDCRRAEETYAELQEGENTRDEQGFLYSSSAY